MAPFTCQFTVWFEEPDTVAWNCSDAPDLTFAEVGETETAMPAGGWIGPAGAPSTPLIGNFLDSQR